MRVLTCFKIVVGLALLATFSFFYSLDALVATKGSNIEGETLMIFHHFIL